MTSTPEAEVAIDPRVAEANRVLLGYDDVAANPVGATSLYTEAMNAGSGEAAARLAVLAAVGVARPANWDEALDRLADGAELGHALSQKQLAVLAGRDDLMLRTGGGALWRKTRGEIDLKTLLKPLPLRRVSTAPSIALIDGLATKSMCRWIISRAKGRMERALIGDYSSGQWVPDPIRTGHSAGFGLVQSDVVMIAVRERLARSSGLIVHQQEAPYVLSYEPGQEYKAHFDFLIPSEPAFAHILATMGQRVATCLTWLNSDYEGGETEFPKIGWRHRGQVGDAMLFLNVTQPDKRPDKLSLHAGLAPTRGKKWLLSQWVRDRVQPIV